MRVQTALSTADALAPDLKALSTLPMPVIDATPSPAISPSTTPGTTSHTSSSAETNQPREHAYRLSTLLLAGDLFIAAIAIFAGLAFREWQRSDLTLQLSQLKNPLLWSIGGSIVYTWLMALLKTYEATNLYKLQFWAKNHLKAIALWCIATWACIGLFHLQQFSPRVGVLYCTLTLSGMLTLWSSPCAL